MSERLIKSINVGTRIIKKYKSGKSKIGYVAETENPTPLDPETNWIVAEKNGDVQCCGPVTVDEIADMPDGSTVQIFTDEELFYQSAQSKAVPWELGLTVKKHALLSHAGKIYSVVQGHTIVDPNHTPDAVLSLYSEIPAPGPSGYPEWVQKYAETYYHVGDRVTHDGKNWECTAADANGNNVWMPGVFGWTVI